MSKRKRERHRQHGNPFHVRGPVEVPDWESLYKRPAPFALDIGFGPGMFLLELAQKNPQWNCLGLEIRQHLVDGALQGAREQGLDNVHAMVANANTQLMDLVPDKSVAFVSLNFPDPWFKKRHRKRRVLNEAWLDLLGHKMMPGGEFHTMTDYEIAAIEAQEILQAHSSYEDQCGGFAAETTTGIVSERELSHQRRGHPVYRQHFIYRAIGDSVDI